MPAGADREQIEANQNTFRAIALEWMERKKANRSAGYHAQVQKIFETDVFPHVGDLPTTAVRAVHILSIMQRVEARGASTFAHLIRQWSSAVFRYADGRASRSGLARDHAMVTAPFDQFCISLIQEWRIATLSITDARSTCSEVGAGGAVFGVGCIFSGC
jgi:hypothetical protein